MENLKNTITPNDNVELMATIAFITDAHAGQKYGDLPYFFHPIEVARTIEDASVAEYLAGLLHDVVEDTEYTSANLRTRYSDEVMDMVDLLTKDDTMSYKENIERIINTGNVGAMKVKLADNRVNAGGDKSAMTAERRQRLTAKYEMSIAMLTGAINERT